MALPYEQLRRALGQPGDTTQDSEPVGDYARVDVGREQRKGLPEIVYAAGKTPDQIVAISRRLLATSGRVIVSRTSPEGVAALETALSNDFQLEHYTASRMVVVRTATHQPAATGGRVAVLTAGTSDLPSAEEAMIVAREMGCQVRLVADVGVAGLHRLFGPLAELFADGVDVMVVAAGMDGALPSVVAGLVPVPVIGLPTPVGYGLGGDGVGALMSMLQSCAPGLAVVNIGNGVGAGGMAALIANQVARARAQVPGPDRPATPDR